MKKAILVLGTGRSGTSALAGCMEILGAFCGNELKAGNPDNARGFFESKIITDLNKHILYANGMAWYFTNPESIRSIESSEEINTLIKKAIHIAYGDKNIIALKDPRFCLLLDGYRRALMELGYEIYYLRTCRKLSGTVASLLATCNLLEENKSMEIVRKYGEILDASLYGFDCMEVAFEDLVANPEAIILALREYLPFLYYGSDNLIRIKEFIDKPLRHH